MKSKPKLILLVGLSGSGKSTFAQKLAKEEKAIIISSDAIREEVFNNYEDQEHNAEVFQIYHKRIRKALNNKQNVIADATNLTMKSRRSILINVKGLDVEKICYILPKHILGCVKDNKNREHPVSDNVLDKQIRKFQVPFYNEGFDKIIIKNFHNRASMINVISVMNDFDQKTPYHDKTLGAHCYHTAKLFESYNYPRYYILGAMYHDVAKLYTQSFDEDGIAHYFGHAEYSAYLFLSELHDTFTDLSCDEFLDICFLINYHMLPFAWKTNKIRQRWKERFGEYKYQMLLDFHECDIAR